MLKKSFLIVMLSLLSAGLVALLIWTWSSGQYFDFRIFWSYISQSNTFKTNFSAFDSLGKFREAIEGLYNYNVIGFNMSNGDTVLKILKVMANFLPYLGNVISFPIQVLLAVLALFVELFAFLLDIVDALILGFTNAWRPFGEGGFIQPIDWYGLLTRIPLIV